METTYLNTEEIYHHALSSIIWVGIMEFTLEDTNVLSLLQKQRASCAQNNIFWKPLSVDKDPRPCCKDDQSTTLTFFMLIWTLYHELWKFMGKREQWKMFLKQCPSFAKFTNCHLLLNSIYNKATVSRINIKVSITPLILLLQVPFTSGPVVL